MHDTLCSGSESWASHPAWPGIAASCTTRPAQRAVSTSHAALSSVQTPFFWWLRWCVGFLALEASHTRTDTKTKHCFLTTRFLCVSTNNGNTFVVQMNSPAEFLKKACGSLMDQREKKDECAKEEYGVGRLSVDRSPPSKPTSCRGLHDLAATRIGRWWIGSCQRRAIGWVLWWWLLRVGLAVGRLLLSVVLRLLWRVA